MSVVPPVRAGLWWVYSLVAITLATVGAGAGEALFNVYDLGDVRSVYECRVHEDLADQSVLRLTRLGNLLTYCSADYHRSLIVVVIVGSVGMLVAAVLLMVAGGVVVRSRLRRVDKSVDAEPLVVRFVELCDRVGLTGRRRPRLIVAPPETGVTQAFTTAVPCATPWVVVPLAYAYADPLAFDAVVAHELGHVRSHDVTWASAVWWAGWLTVPPLIVAVLPILTAPSVIWQFHAMSFGLAIVSAVSTLALRAALLRRRERAADRHVVDVLGDPKALQAFVRAPSLRRERTSPLARVFATHEITKQRLKNATADTGTGFVFSAIVSVVVMRLFHTADALLSDSLGPIDGSTRLPNAIAWSCAALVWAATLVPAWTRRASSADPRWWAPASGAVLGLVVGYCVEPAGATQVVMNFYGSYLAVVGACVAVAGLAAVVLAISIAVHLSAPTDSPVRRRLSTLGGVVAAAAALAVLMGAATAVASVGKALGPDESKVRRSVLAEGAIAPWHWLAPVVISGLIVLALRTRRVPITRVSVVVVAVTASIGATAATWWRSHRPIDALSTGERFMIIHHQWWICALAGLVATATVYLAGRHGDRGVPTSASSAVLCGFVTTCLAGGLGYVALGLKGIGRNTTLIEQSLWWPGWLYVVALVVTLPVALILVAVTACSGRTGRVRWWWVPGAAAATLLLVAALTSGWLSRVTVTDHDFTSESTAVSSVEMPAPRTVAGPQGDPGHTLEPTAVRDALAKLPSLLPGAASKKDVSSSPESTASASSCDRATYQFNAVEKAKPRSIQAEDHYLFPGDGIAWDIELIATITSYDSAWDYLFAYDDLVRECAHYQLPAERYDGGLMNATQHPAPLPPNHYQTRRTVGTLTGTMGRYPSVITIVEDVVVVGRNVFTITTVRVHQAVPPPQQTIDRLDVLATEAMRTLMTSA